MYGVNSRCHCKQAFNKQMCLLLCNFRMFNLCIVKYKIIPTNSLAHSHNNMLRKDHKSQCNLRSRVRSAFKFNLRLYNMLPHHLKILDIAKLKQNMWNICSRALVFTLLSNLSNIVHMLACGWRCHKVYFCTARINDLIW